jgi:uncharacterized protein
MEPLSDDDLRTVSAQLNRPSRGAIGVGHRCPCGLPAVVVTRPRLADGTPFPTTYYATCPRLNAAMSRLEAGGFMRQAQDLLAQDEAAAAAYRQAHQRYLADRSALGEEVPEISGVSAGGMPDRVKCLHALAAQSLASGPGVNPIGDLALAAAGPWWDGGPCVAAGP